MSAWLLWLVIAGALAAAETASLSFVLVMAAGGAAAASLTAGLGAPVALQVVIAILVTVGLVWGVRPVAIRHLSPDPRTLTGTEALIGSEAVVLQEVSRHDGRVRLNGSEWSARAMDPNQKLPAGTVVSVVDIDGATAVVWQDPFG
jgi:membrane protein implicated in regulation of membrane protease activity